MSHLTIMANYEQAETQYGKCYSKSAEEAETDCGLWSVFEQDG